MRHAGALDSAAHPTAQPVFTAMPHPCRGLLLSVAARLRGPGLDRPVAPRGIAVLKDLLSDGGGPFYTPGDPETLRRRLRSIDGFLDALD